MARPSTYTPAKAKAVKASIIRQFTDGKGLAAVARECGVSRQTLYAWMDDDQSLSDTFTHAKDLSLAWWEDLTLNCAESGKGNAALIKMHLTNKHPEDYVERRELKVDAEVGIFEIDFTGYDEDDAEDE